MPAAPAAILGATSSGSNLFIVSLPGMIDRCFCLAVAITLTLSTRFNCVPVHTVFEMRVSLVMPQAAIWPNCHSCCLSVMPVRREESVSPLGFAVGMKPEEIIDDGIVV